MDRRRALLLLGIGAAAVGAGWMLHRSRAEAAARARVTRALPVLRRCLERKGVAP
jgi:hypothetical protein